MRRLLRFRFVAHCRIVEWRLSLLPLTAARLLLCVVVHVESAAATARVEDGECARDVANAGRQGGRWERTAAPERETIDPDRRPHSPAAASRAQ